MQNCVRDPKPTMGKIWIMITVGISKGKEYVRTHGEVAAHFYIFIGQSLPGLAQSFNRRHMQSNEDAKHSIEISKILAQLSYLQQISIEIKSPYFHESNSNNCLSIL